jgi:soluble lytic murein transglycosylase-like protein
MRNAFRIVFASFFFLATAGAITSQASANNSSAFAALIATHASANGIPVALAQAVVRHESNFNPRVTGRAGEIGLMQIKLQTARGMGYTGSRKGLYDPATNIKWGMKYLGQARRLAGGSECGTLSRYNGGLGTKRMIKGYCRQVAAYAATAAKGKHAVKLVRIASAAPVAPASVAGNASIASDGEGNILKTIFASLQ